MHDDVAAASAHFHKPMLAKQSAELFSAENAKRLPNGDLYAGDVNILVQALLDFTGRGGLKKQLQRFPQISRASSMEPPWLEISTSGQSAT